MLIAALVLAYLLLLFVLSCFNEVHILLWALASQKEGSHCTRTFNMETLNEWLGTQPEWDKQAIQYQEKSSCCYLNMNWTPDLTENTSNCHERPSEIVVVEQNSKRVQMPIDSYWKYRQKPRLLHGNVIAFYKQGRRNTQVITLVIVLSAVGYRNGLPSRSG